LWCWPGARRVAPLLALVLLSLPAVAATRVTVQELEQALTASKGSPDKDAAQRLIGLELTERLSKSRFDRLKAELPGEKAQLAMLALADASAFFDLPAADALHIPAPDKAAQGQILSKAADFVIATQNKMPDFLATRITTRFTDLKVSHVYAEPLIVADQGFQFTDRLSATVRYRDGREVVEAAADKKAGNRVAYQTGLSNWGVFGPLLANVMADILKGKLGWGHWEQGSAGHVAVFRYAVPEEKSTYNVKYCCFLGDDQVMHDFKVVPAYHGEIAIDPDNGAVFRLVVKCDLEPGLQVSRAEVVVEYSQVEIGGKTFICPTKSISVTTATNVVSRGVVYMDGKTFYDDIVGKPKVTAINDDVFDNYHQFRGEMRILPEASAEPDANPSAPITPPTPKSPPTQ
jgi:hypothetical protein